MIQNESYLRVCDNSGARVVRCIKVLGSSKKRYAYIGDLLKISVKKNFLNSKLKKGDVYTAILIRSVYNFKRFDGSLINFNDNAVARLNNKFEFLGSRITGPVLKELKLNNIIGVKIMNLSSNII